MTFLPSQSKMCEQEHMLIIAYGFWCTLKDMSLGWMTCVTSFDEI